MDLGHPTGLLQYKKLLDLTTPGGSALFEDYVVRERRNIADVLYDFSSVRENEGENALRLEELLAILKPMGPREYSIASSPAADSALRPDGTFSVDLCVAITKGVTKLGRKWVGGCSRYWLEAAADGEVGGSMRVWLRRGSFVKAADCPEKPVMCIGAGTGVAPLRGILRERARRRAGGEGAARDVLVFGARQRKKDFYYEREWGELPGLELITAFSQDQIERIYVQKVIAQAGGGDLIVQHLLVNKGCLAIAGGAKMASDVVKKIKEIMALRVEGGAHTIERLFVQLKRSGAFAVEAW